MDGGAVERVGGVLDAEEAGGLLESLGAEAGDFEQLGAGGEGALLVAARDDGGGGGGVEAGDVGEELLGGGVELDADAVHAGDDGIVEGAFEAGLVHVMLVLADTDGFGVEFNEFGEGVHEAAADGDGAADGEVVVGEFFAGDLGGGVDGGAGFVDHDDGDGGGQAAGADEGLGLAAGGAVADGDGLDLETGGEAEDLVLGLGGAHLGVDDVVVEEFALAIEEHGFAAGAEAGVDGHDVLATEGGGEEEFADVVGEDFDRGEVGGFFGFEAHLGLHGGGEEALEGVGDDEAELGGGGGRGGGGGGGFDDEALELGEGEGLVGEGDAHHDEQLLLGAAHGEEAVAGALGEGLGPVEVVLELGGLGGRVLTV